MLPTDKAQRALFERITRIEKQVADLATGGRLQSTVGDYALLSEVYCDVDGEAVYFDPIPLTFTHLRIFGLARCTATALFSTFFLRPNNSLSADRHFYMEIARSSGVTHDEGYYTASPLLGYVLGATSPVNSWTAFDITIANYAATSPKSLLAKSNALTAFFTGGFYSVDGNAVFTNPAPITRLDMLVSGGVWAAGSRISLYGLE